MLALVGGKMTNCNGILPRKSLPGSVAYALTGASFRSRWHFGGYGARLVGSADAVLDSEDRPRIDPQTLRHMVGHGARALIEQAMASTGAPATPDHLPLLVDRFIDHYRNHLADNSLPFPDVVETLAGLRSQGARLAVLTNKPQELTVPILDALNLSRYFG